jgi:hypothetical protein
MMPPTYNANLQILQTGKHVVIFHEMIHDARIIPLDGRAHLPPGVRNLAGDSVGHWEGETLVVDTTNFTSAENQRGATLSPAGHLASDANTWSSVTPIDRNHIRYTFTIRNDEQVVRRVPLRRFDGPLFEYACHEGNYGLPNILRGARADEK